MSQQPVRVVVEKKPSGCGTALAVMILLGLAIEYWYVSIAMVAIVIAIAIARAARQRERARHKPGPRDPWLNEVVVTLADLGLEEIARNTGGQLGGIPMEGDIGVEGERLRVYVNLFSNQRLARDAELGLRAKPKVREGMSTGVTAIETMGRVVYVANGRGAVVDGFLFEEVVRVVGRVAVPSPLAEMTRATVVDSRAVPSSVPAPVEAVPDVLEQLGRLGELRDAGVLTDEDFDAKKAELLGRI
jgi:Short C-terminal domain